MLISSSPLIFEFGLYWKAYWPAFERRGADDVAAVAEAASEESCRPL